MMLTGSLGWMIVRLLQFSSSSLCLVCIFSATLSPALHILSYRQKSLILDRLSALWRATKANYWKREAFVIA